jgi:PAS domain-containing protein
LVVYALATTPLASGLVLIKRWGGAVYLLEATNGIRSDMPLDVFAIGFLFLMYAVALFGFHIFDPLPPARQTVIAQMQDGMLVLDPQGRVASLNPAAEQMLGLPAKLAHGRLVRELLPAYPDGQITDAGEPLLSSVLEKDPRCVITPWRSRC